MIVIPNILISIQSGYSFKTFKIHHTGTIGTAVLGTILLMCSAHYNQGVTTSFISGGAKIWAELWSCAISAFDWPKAHKISQIRTQLWFFFHLKMNYFLLLCVYRYLGISFPTMPCHASFVLPLFYWFCTTLLLFLICREHMLLYHLNLTRHFRLALTIWSFLLVKLFCKMWKLQCFKSQCFLHHLVHIYLKW